MEIPYTSLAFVLAALCAGVMGFAIQRGATCTVAAMDEVVNKRSGRRLASLAEASLWVAGGLLLLKLLHFLPQMPTGYVATGWTALGGVLLGLGAFVNRACVFGAIARLGSGEWAYVLSPLGFYLGCLSAPWLFTVPPHTPLLDGSVVLKAPAWVGGLFILFVAWRLLHPLRTWAAATVAERVWSPHAATTVIGLTFLAMLTLVGTWAYTDVLAELARGMASNLWQRSALLWALLRGAAWGGHTAGRWRSTSVTWLQVLRCLAGGALMGWGTLLIPGGNDGLILVGMPLLWPYAWLAFANMCISIAVAQMAQATWQRYSDGGPARAKSAADS